jgi:hypothetical protein
MNTAPECHPRAKAADEERTRPVALAHATRVTTLGELAALHRSRNRPAAGSNRCIPIYRSI